MTLLSLIDEYEIYLVSEKGVSEKTYLAYQKDLNDFLTVVKNKDIKDIRREDFTSYRNFLKKQNYSQSTCARKITAVRCLFSYLEKEKGIQTEEMNLYFPKQKERLPVVLNVEEVSAMIQSIDSSSPHGILDKTMLSLMFYTGLRVSELVSLRNDYIYLEGGYLKVLGKRRKERVIPLTEEAVRLIEVYQKNYRKNIKENPLLFFVHPDGKPVSRQYFFLKVKEAAKKAGIEKKVSPHTLRHSYATALLLSGVSLVQVKALLGHEDIKTTAIYTHLTQNKEKEVYNKAMKRSHPH